ncbi:hypothetical protein [Jeotgalicoccus halotolerans]|uniref:DUF4181 domain-containing protein n=1 Tax=Jeotgalicoccus halotolerans TaxID=157227 RepID=A0A3E0AY70_9STAP|nr:hypothetical protein [Jeotgalicoccus halotolerans]REG24658.1 hypothetical protein DFR63_0965 [Jeotgalicoccus halotolerans]
MYILLFVLVAGLLLKFAMTTFFNDDRLHFSFDERRYFSDEKAIGKIMRLKLVYIERVFLVLMTVVFIIGAAVFFTGNITLGVWFLVSVVILQLILNIVTDFKLYTALHDKSNLVMTVIWLLLIIGLIILTNIYIL